MLLIGAPSGGGKTTFSKNLITGQIQTPLLEPYTGFLSRTDAKSMVQKRFPRGGLIIEFATNRIETYTEITAVTDMIRLLQAHTKVMGAHTIQINRTALVKHYLGRMRGKDFIKLGKLKTALHYALIYNIQTGISNWNNILDNCNIKNEPIQLHKVTSRPKSSAGADCVNEPLDR